MNVLELQDVRKTYQDHVACDNVSFEVPEGKLFGLLGPNGAGKTSLIRIITTITKADSGTVYFRGEPLNSSHPSQIGYMPEERGLYKKMKVGEQIIYLARLKGLSRSTAKKALDYWLEKFDIQDWKDKMVQELSKGMQQKIQFITTVIHEPKLLILDEPFSGLDPVNANLIRDEIDELHRNGTTILFSTHRMEQVEQICENIVLINKGSNVLSGAVSAVKERFKENLFQVGYAGELPADLQEQVPIVNQTSDTITVQLANDAPANQLLGYLIDQGVTIRSFQEVLPTLNQIFIKIVGGQSDE